MIDPENYEILLREIQKAKSCEKLLRQAISGSSCVSFIVQDNISKKRIQEVEIPSYSLETLRNLFKILGEGNDVELNKVLVKQT